MNVLWVRKGITGSEDTYVAVTMFNGSKLKSIAPICDFKIETCYYNEYLHISSAGGMKKRGFEDITVHQYPYNKDVSNRIFDYMFYENDKRTLESMITSIKAVFEG